MSANFTSTEPITAKSATNKDKSPFDYIIVGSGAAGGPLACRLAIAGKKVLLVEAGRDPKQELIDNAKKKLAEDPDNAPYKNPEDATAVLEAPLFHGAATEDEALSWQFSVRHYDDDSRQANDHKYDPARDPSSGQLDPTLPGSPPKGSKGKGGIFYPRSAGIGGCTGHHAMICVRPNPRDWEHISQLTNDPSWSAKSMQPYFARMERNLYLEEYQGALTKLLGWFYKLLVAVMRFINPKAVLDKGGHGFEGWQPTNFISIDLVNTIVKVDAELTKVLLQSAFKVVKNQSALASIFKRFAITLGFVRTLDMNDEGERTDDFEGGVFLIPQGIGGSKDHENVVDENGNSGKGRRIGVREFILTTAKKYPNNLVIESGVHVLKILFDDSPVPRAIGVEGVAGDHLYRASPLHRDAKAGDPVKYYASQCGGEVIISGGSFNTPQLLMLSGIGPKTELEKQGIASRVNLDGVGRNLQDRYEVCVVSELKDEFKSLDTVSFDASSTSDLVLKQWRDKKEGLYSVNGGTVAILQKSSAQEGPNPDLFTFGAPAAFRGYYWNWSKETLRPVKGAPNNQHNLWSWVILKAYTRNNGGWVKLRSADPFDTPDICFRSFDEGVDASQSDKDVDAMLEAIDTMRCLNSQDGSPFRAEIQPKGYLEQKNAERRARGLPEWTLRDWIKNEAWGHHCCGTCRMGSDSWKSDVADLQDKFAVLDSHFRVHGVKGLRVVDASVFPVIPSYFILAAVFMVGEKAADTLLNEQSNSDFPDELRDLEYHAIASRRAVALVSPANELAAVGERPAPAILEDECDNVMPPRNVVGLALSGGGVRSSTFATGVLQSLAKKGLLRHIDYLSTVSGGGFAGGFLGRLFMRDRVKLAEHAVAPSKPLPEDAPREREGDPVGRVQEILADNNSNPMRWLRTQANYLFASGSDDWLQAVAIYFRNVFTVHLVIGTWLVALFGIVAGVSKFGWYQKLVPQAPVIPVTWTSKYITLPESLQLVLSAWWWVPLAVVALVVLPLKLGYWLAPKRMSCRPHPPHPLLAWLILLAGASVALAFPKCWWAGGVLVVLGLAWLFQEIARYGLSEAEVVQRRIEGPIVRNRLTRGLGEALVIFLATTLLIVVDSVAATVASARVLPQIIGVLIAFAPGLQMLRTKLTDKIAKGETDSLGRMEALGAVIGLVLLCVSDVVAHTIFVDGSSRWAWGCVLVALLFSAAIGRAFDLLNYTSLHATYSGRITRTFLGASNEARTEGTDNMAADVGVAHPNDDIAHSHYRPEQQGGPLHLIGVCVNETIDHASQREIRDWKGLLMTLSSFGVSIGRRHFAKWSPTIDPPGWLKWRRQLEGVISEYSTALVPVPKNPDPSVFHPLGRRDGKPAVVQALSLGDWLGVSGAAFSTGTGRNTTPLLALFMGLLNVRLGFWWDSGIKATERSGRYPANVWRRLKEIPGAIFRAHELLLSEWKGRFDGPTREFWNLSDGGHIDNSSTYELIRRRVRFIIATDSTRDLDYSYADISHLMRMARVDFGAEIVWLDDASTLPAPFSNWVKVANVGKLDDIRGNPSRGGPGTKQAALARIDYSDGSTGWMLLIKASLSDDLPRDIKQYATQNGDFPQDSTADQIYDADQWESYRYLGEQIAGRVFN